MTGRFKADKFGEGAKRLASADERTGSTIASSSTNETTSSDAAITFLAPIADWGKGFIKPAVCCDIDSPAAAMRLDAGAFAGHLEAVADVIEEQEMAAGYLIREAMRRIHEQEREIERLKFHARHLRKSAEEAAEYLRQLVQVSETPGVRLQHVVFSLASALATSRNLPL